MTCPTCRGEKTITGIGCPGGHIITMACHRCGGTGIVADNQKVWVSQGQKMKKSRMDKNLSLREAAARIGIKAFELSQMENGMKEPDEKLLEKL